MPEVNGRWNPPALSEQGSPTAEDLYLSVGRVLSTWERVEMMLAKLFGLLVEGNADAAERAYGTLPGSTGRAGMIREAAMIYAQRRVGLFPLDEVKLLLKHYRDASERRAEVAHGMVMSINIGEESRGFFLVPAVYRSQQNERKTFDFWEKVQAEQGSNPFAVFGFKFRYTHADLDGLNSLFNELFAMVNGIWAEQFTMGIHAQMATAQGAAAPGAR